MRFSIISLLAAFAVLNVAPGYDACGNKLPGYEEQKEDSVEWVTDSTEHEVESFSFDADSTDL